MEPREEKGEEGRGRLIVVGNEVVPRGKFCLCTNNGDKLVSFYSGSYYELADSFCANGEARNYFFRGQDVYYVFNPADLNDEEVRRRILPPGVELI